MITVTVHLHTVLQRRTPQGPQRRLEMGLPVGTPLRSLLDQLQIEYPEPLIMIVNGRWAEPSQVLQDGDEIHLIPPVSGGCAD